MSTFPLKIKGFKFVIFKKINIGNSFEKLIFLKNN